MCLQSVSHLWREMAAAAALSSERWFRAVSLTPGHAWPLGTALWSVLLLAVGEGFPLRVLFVVFRDLLGFACSAVDKI